MNKATFIRLLDLLNIKFEDKNELLQKSNSETKEILMCYFDEYLPYKVTLIKLVQEDLCKHLIINLSNIIAEYSQLKFSEYLKIKNYTF